MTDTVQRLREVIRDALKSKKDLDIAPTTPLEDVVTSSLQFVVVLGEIERVFDIVIPHAYLDPAKLRNLASIAQMIEQLQKRAG